MSAPTARTHVVRLRVRGLLWSSPVVTHTEAQTLQRELCHQVRDCGEGTGFVEFHAISGRDVAVRGRDVVAIEVDRWVGPRTDNSAAAGGAAAGGSVNAVPVTGTDWLRQHSGHDRTPVVR